MAMRGLIGFSAGNRSWTETYVHQDGASGLDGVMTDLVALATARSQLLGAGVTITWLRASDTQNLRSVKTQAGITPNFQAGVPYYVKAYGIPPGGGDPIFTDFPYSTVLCKKVAEAGNCVYSGNLYLSGAPDDLQLENKQNISDAVWLDAFKSFRDVLKKNWALRVIDRDTTPLKQIQSIAETAPYALHVPGHGYTNGTRVSIIQMKLDPAFNKAQGQYYISVVDADNFTLNGWDPIKNPNTVLVKTIFPGFVRQVLRKQVPITDLTETRFTAHKRGASFLRPLGKSRPRKRS